VRLERRYWPLPQWTLVDEVIGTRYADRLRCPRCRLCYRARYVRKGAGWSNRACITMGPALFDRDIFQEMEEVRYDADDGRHPDRQ
jgi:hypothetical protein